MWALSITLSAYLSDGLSAKKTSRTLEYEPSPMLSTVTKSDISNGLVVVTAAVVDAAEATNDVAESPRACFWASSDEPARALEVIRRAVTTGLDVLRDWTSYKQY
jgi:hypothetical protein